MKKEDILRPDLHKQIIELLDQDYKISPDQILVNVNQITFDKIPKMDPPRAQNYNNILPLSVHRPRVTQYSDSQIQTDLTFKDIKVKGQMDAVYSEVEILGFTYMTEEERQEQLKMLLNDDCPIEKYSYDPCTEFTSFSRYNDPSLPVPRMRSISSNRKQVPVALTRSIGSQTLYTSNSIHRSTQTINDYSTSTTSTENSPLHKLVIAKTRATIKSDLEGNNKIKERFSLQNKKDYSIGYSQTSEYETNNGKGELIKSNLSIDKIQEESEATKETNEDLDRRKLVKSTMEMTSVINNKTTVTGISVKDAPEKFTIQIINPDNRNEEKSSLSQYLNENLELNSNTSSPILDRKLVEDIYENNELKIATKPFNVKCNDEKVIKEEDLGLNNESNNSSVKYPARYFSKNLSPRSILQSSPDLSKHSSEMTEYSIKKLPAAFNFERGDLRKNHSEKNIPNNPELNDSFTQIEENKVNSPKLEPRARTNLKNFSNQQIENNSIKKNPALFQQPTKRDEIGSNFKKNLIEKNINSLDQIPTNLKINAPKGEAVVNFKKSLMDNKANKDDSLSQTTEYSVKKIPAVFKIEQLNKEPKSNFKKTLTEDKNARNFELNDSQRFSIDKIPKMFRYEAKEPQPISANSKLGLSDELRKKLSHNEMVLLDDKNFSPKSIIKQRNTSQESYTQKQMRKVDFDENMVDIDFDAYEKPRVVKKVIEIEEPLDPIEHIERASFRTDSTNSSKPEIKERRQVAPSNDITPQKLIHPIQPSSNFKQRLLTKNQIVS